MRINIFHMQIYMHQLNRIINRLIHVCFKIYAYIIVIGCHTYRKLYKLTAKLYPDYIINIKIIDTYSNKVYICHKNIKELLNSNKPNGSKFYIIHIWNRNTNAVDYYIINDTILFQIYMYVPIYLTSKTNMQCIKNIRSYYELNKKENNIYAIMIDNKDVTQLFQKYRSSISIPGNLTAHALYVYYCSKSSVSLEPIITRRNDADALKNKNIMITCIDYNLDEQIFHYNDLISH